MSKQAREKVGKESKQAREKKASQRTPSAKQAREKPHKMGVSWELKRKGKMPSLSFPSLNLSDKRIVALSGNKQEESHCLWMVSGHHFGDTTLSHLTLY